MAWVYILYSKSKDRYYIGSTIDLEARLAIHNSGRNLSTKSGLPWEIVYSEEYLEPAEARSREYKLKQMKSRKYIEELIGKSKG